MQKWLVIFVILIGLLSVITYRQQSVRKPSVAMSEIQRSNTTSNEERCRSMDGRLVEGVGCVKGDVPSNANPQIGQAEMEAICKRDGSQYVASINACQRSNGQATAEQCRSIGGRIIEGMGCVRGDIPSNANPQIAPAEMEAICKQDGSRYVASINACVSN
jgi:hypothetical protein